MTARAHAPEREAPGASHGVICEDDAAHCAYAPTLSLCDEPTFRKLGAALFRIGAWTELHPEAICRVESPAASLTLVHYHPSAHIGDGGVADADSPLGYELGIKCVPSAELSAKAAKGACMCPLPWRPNDSSWPSTPASTPLLPSSLGSVELDVAAHGDAGTK